MKFAKFLGTLFLTEHLCWLLVKGRSDFQTKGERKREREREKKKSTGADRSSITTSYIDAIK